MAELDRAGARFTPIMSPLFQIVQTEAHLPLDGVRGLIFSSVHGVAAWKARDLQFDMPCYIVGQATAQAAQAAGLRPAIVQPTAASLVKKMLDTGVEGPLLHLHGTHTRGDIARRLTFDGLYTRAVAVYDQPELELNETARAALVGDVPVVAPVFSPRTASLLAREKAKAPLLVAAMSEAVALALPPLHIVFLKVADRPDSGAMLAAVQETLDRAHAQMERSGASPDEG
ncbi:uroporphyrinogen-III synthase [Sagittula stellata]|uniref:uroporphyrinogen-III synthase n=1 Tax=Sagittula stellata TaxID=52603 RepID=UPI0012F4D0A1|nr:uroporphyrinogen-III synthase [Sagittula stellata]